MGGWIAIAVVTMMCAVMIQHLGLTEAVAIAVSNAASCAKCCTLWIVLVVLLTMGADWFIAVSLSILMSYLSHYFGIVLMAMQKLYNKLWERANK